MPVFRGAGKLFYFAHVPKCGGSSIELYLKERFGAIGLVDHRHLSVPERLRWSRTSPQHVDWATLTRFMPEAMFDGVFTVVRHPVARIVSDYVFQIDVEKTVAPATSFSDWLRATFAGYASDRYMFDNHIRPQVEFAPEGCTVFHLEHGLDAIIPYIDALVGDENGPRFVGHTNQRRPEKGASREAAPSAEDLALIREFYAADFARFGYVPDQPKPVAPQRKLDPAFLAASEAQRQRASRPISRLATKVLNRLR
jgi:hypothetical protein